MRYRSDDDGLNHPIHLDRGRLAPRAATCRCSAAAGMALVELP
jgi:hypothetical protein